MPDRVLQKLGRAHGVLDPPIVPPAARRPKGIHGRKAYDVRFLSGQRIGMSDSTLITTSILQLTYAPHLLGLGSTLMVTLSGSVSGPIFVCC